MIRSRLEKAGRLSRFSLAALLSLTFTVTGAMAGDTIMLERIGAVRFIAKAEGYAVDPAQRVEIFRLQGRRVAAEQASLMTRPDAAPAQH
ncbi:hypothetical protein Msil_1121 [Methylocella silvestris BL2]|uniref:Uncharacterized protein n=1 Tax=Methylocella silvestris (strain DSM 15510 / CIP 108128 / LMG 27833 / NCIMB 13906 / BL2) TaxID=395965 RepID=B8ENF9_METSB|nr:hypothetical protein [Methylocella silvestris]ACK50090.1 hypothetical protein Msil_1121 [Methylocella silvestris BL2]